jgi:hypothetical protein
MNINWDQIIEALRRGEFDYVESMARDSLARQRFYLTHLVLIQVLIDTGRLGEADLEFEILISYKFNLADRLDKFPDILRRYEARLRNHYIVSTMRPNLSFEGQVMPSSIARWDLRSQLPSREDFLNEVRRQVLLAVPVQELISVDRASICTFGSCFAANVARILILKGMSASNLLIEESINSTYANRILLELVYGIKGSLAHQAMRSEFGDLLIDQIRSQLRNASHIILTVGVAPSFFDTGTGDFVFSGRYSELLRTGKVRMRTTTCAENVSNLRIIIDILENLAPETKKIITLSPVPLAATAEISSILMADCVSKSTLRAAVYEIMQDNHGLTYFPAFELVRWLAAYTSEDVYGADDKNSRHVSNWVVEVIVESFIERFFLR